MNILDDVLTYAENDALWRKIRNGTQKAEKLFIFMVAADPCDYLAPQKDAVFKMWEELIDLLDYINKASESDPIGA